MGKQELNSYMNAMTKNLSIYTNIHIIHSKHKPPWQIRQHRQIPLVRTTEIRVELHLLIVQFGRNIMCIIYDGCIAFTPALHHFTRSLRKNDLRRTLVPPWCMHECKHDSRIRTGVAETCMPEPQVAKHNRPLRHTGLDRRRVFSPCFEQLVADPEFRLFACYGLISLAVLVVGKRGVAVCAEPELSASVRGGRVDEVIVCDESEGEEAVVEAQICMNVLTCSIKASQSGVPVHIIDVRIGAED